MKAGSRWLMSSSTCDRPSRFISPSIARATMSRGASSAIGCKAGMKRSPVVGRRRYAPSPRKASVSRKFLTVGWNRHVGWNWLNSMFATRHPARHAIAIPSPVAPSGLVE